MTPEQVRAADSIRRALRKAADAGLSLRIYGGSVYAVAVDVLSDCDDSYYACLDHGVDVGGHITADGGAGR